jgi:hypothetical protein
MLTGLACQARPTRVADFLEPIIVAVGRHTNCPAHEPEPRCSSVRGAGEPGSGSVGVLTGLKGRPPGSESVRGAGEPAKAGQTVSETHMPERT